MQPTIYHNPHCSKSRETLALLEDHGFTPHIVKYLETPPDADTLRKLLVKLGLRARDVLRTGEAAYQDLGLANPALTDDELIAAIVQHPALLQRPIVVAGDNARMGRPPEAVLEIL